MITNLWKINIYFFLIDTNSLPIVAFKQNVIGNIPSKHLLVLQSFVNWCSWILQKIHKKISVSESFLIEEKICEIEKFLIITLELE